MCGYRASAAAVHPGVGGTRTTGAIGQLAQHLVELGVEKVTVESTSDYWRIWYYLLEVAGLSVQLVNARDVKNVPGRPKTDKLDAVWLAKLTEKGLLRPSFVPPAPIRRLRDYTRLRTDLTHDRSRQVQRLEKLLEDALIKLSAVATDIMGVSGRAMIEALIAGQRDPKVLAGLARGRMKTKHSALVAALNGRFDDHHAELARMLLDQIDALSTQIDTLTARIEQLIAEMPDALPSSTPRPRAGPSLRHPVGVDNRHRPADAPRLRPARRAARRDPRHRPERGADDHRRDRPGHEPLPHPRAPGVVGETVPAHHPVRADHPRRQNRQGQPLPERRARRRRRRGRQDQHLPRRTLPAHRQTPRQAQGPGRGRPLHPRSSSGTCLPIPPPASTTSDPTTTPAASTSNERSATTSPN